MPIKRMFATLIAGVVVCGAAGVRVGLGADVKVTVDPSRPGVTIPEDFLGASFEMQLVTPGKDGRHYFSPDNKGLAGVFRSLGIRSLRVGGNTADRPTVPVPTHEDIDELFGFAKEAGTKVIYTLRLREGDPSKAAEAARYVMGRFGEQVECIAAGNEPNVYAKTYEEYRELTKRYYAAIEAAAPGVRFCGPGTTPGKAVWARSYAEDFGPTGTVKLVTQHAYPGGSARKVTDAAKARADMLSREWLASYQKMYDAFVLAALKAGVRYRLEETNSFFNGGARDVSDTQAAAAWALDYLYWWAEHGAAGLNFHTGDHVAAGEQNTPCRYALWWTTDKGADVHPIGYAAKAFGLAAHGTLVPAKVEGDANVTAYAVKGAGLFVTVINKETAASERVTVTTVDQLMAVRTVEMAAPDVAATSGTTLGGGKIAEDGTWDGQWTMRPGVSGDGSITLDLPPASAVIVEFAK